MRNRKHPDRSGYKRPARTRDYGSDTAYCVTAVWPTDPVRNSSYTTTEAKVVKRLVRKWEGAYITIAEHRGHGLWRTTRVIDGPAIAAQATREAADAQLAARDAAEAAAREGRHRADLAAQASRNAVAAYIAATTDHDRLAALMRQPPGTRDQRARHTAGG